MIPGWFVTGTDTGVGKTRASQAILMALAAAGKRVVGMKPVATGCEAAAGAWRAADAATLIAAGNVAADYVDINPYAFGPATAPHLAAQAAGVEIELEVIRTHYQRLARRAEHVVVEGIGGWLVPLSPTASVADIPAQLGLPVILVVGLRLGAINHALLTQEAMHTRRCAFTGWIANAIDSDFPFGYVETLQARLAAPLLGVIAHGANPSRAALGVDVAALLRARL
jgi:dethiobiotin synthetase